MIDSRFYYYLINKSTEKAIGFKNIKDIGQQQAYFEPVDETSLHQVWMLKETHLEKVYYLTHCQTGLVIEKAKNKNLQLHHSKGRVGQYFYVNRAELVDQYWIQEYYLSSNLLSQCKNQLKCENTQPHNKEAIWIIKRVTKNQQIISSCTVMSQSSAFVLQIKQSNDGKGKELRQSSWTGMFSQRWVFKKAKDFWVISNLKSNMVIGIGNKKIKEGVAVLQIPENQNNFNQLWSIQERGYRIYAIRTAYDQELFIGTQDRSLKDKVEVTLIKDQFKNLWKIVGPLNGN